MKNKFCFLLILLAAAGAAAAADDENDAAVAPPDTVIVPFDGTKPVASQHPDSVYIPYERFVELWEAAKANKQGRPPEELAQSYVLSSARYDAKLDDGALHVSGVIDLETFKDDWVSVPLAFRDVKLGVLKLDGQPAPLGGAGVAISKAGRHRIEVEFDIPVGSDKTRMSWGIPKTAGTLFAITLPDKQMKASVQPGNGMVERINGDRKIVTAALGSTDHVDLLLDSSVGLSTINQAAVAKIDTTLNITPAVELMHTGFGFSFPESQQDHFTVSLDKALALVKLDVPNLKSWKLTVGNDSQSLEIILAEPARGSFKFSFDAERTSAEKQRRFPFVSAAANRIEQTSALFSTPFLDVTPQPSAALRQISFPQQQNAGLRLVAAYSSIGDKELLAYGVQPAKLSNKADISYVYLVNHSKIELVAALKLRIKNATLFDVTLGLPGDFVVEAVESDRLKDWWREGDVLHVRFKGEAPDAATPLVLHLVKLFKAVPDALEIKPLTLPDTWEVEGNGIIAASTSVQAEMTLAEAKEINPQNAATDFRILPPMERKRGFSFKGQDFHASVKLETLPPRVNGTWVMSAQAHESWVSVSTHVSLSARQGSAPGVSFRLPASTPEARVTGDNVRETTSTVEEGWRVYQVAFQNDLTDQTGFTVDFDLPGDGNVSLPAFEFLPKGVERAEGFVIVDNASEYEMQVNPAGLEVALTTQIPFLPQVSRNARLFRALPGWTLQISLTRLEKEAGRSALVEWAELKTAIRTDGSEWHSASYHLLNHSLQFLPVKLPEGSELASVSVAGENVRADQGKVDGKEVLLVPLIKTNLGDLPYDVILVYRKKGKSLWTFSRETLSDPEVVGITVGRTLWTLYIPEGSNAGHFGGNMEQVLEEVNETEKQEGTLDEITKLKSIAFDTNNSVETRHKAGESFQKLARTLQDSSQAGKDADRLYANVDEYAYQTQTKANAVKKQEIQQELKEEQKDFEENNTRLNQADMQVAQENAALAGPAAKKPVSQVWAGNGSYKPDLNGAVTVDKAKEIDRQNPEGRQLYVNDYVVNVQDGKSIAVTGGNATAIAGIVSNSTGGTTLVGAGTLSLSGSNSYTGATIANGGVLAVPADSVQGQVSQIQAQQTMQRQGGKSAPVAANPPPALGNSGGGGQITSGLRSGNEAISGGTIDSLLSPQANQNGTLTINATGTTTFSGAIANSGTVSYGSPIQPNGGGNVKVLNNARANTDTNTFFSPYEDQQAARQEAGADATATMAAAAVGDQPAPGRPSNTVGFGAGAGEGQGEGVSLDAAAAQLEDGNGFGMVGGGIGGGAGGGGGGGVLQGPAQLQPAGSISLPVDFPIEGLQVYHFKKLKSNATLTFRLTNAQGLDRWKWLAVFLVVALVLKAVFIFIDRGYLRLLRRRIVHI